MLVILALSYSIFLPDCVHTLAADTLEKKKRYCLLDAVVEVLCIVL